MVAGLKDKFSALSDSIGGVPHVTKNAKDALNIFNSLSNKQKGNWDKVAAAIGKTDEGTLAYLKTVGKGEATVEGLAESNKKLGYSFNWAALRSQLASIAIGIAIALVIKAVTALISKNKEMMESFVAASKETQDNIKELDEYQSKIKSLQADIDSGNLTYQEAYDKRLEILGIQDEIIEKYGEEAAAVRNLKDANAEYIDILKQGEAQKFLRTERDAILSFTSERKDRPVAYDKSLKPIYDRYGEVRYSAVPMYGGEVAETYALVDATTDEWIEFYQSVYKDIYEKVGVAADFSKEERDRLLDRIQGELDRLDTEDYQKRKSAFNTAGEMALIADHLGLYNDLIKKRKEYDEAIASGDKLAAGASAKSIQEHFATILDETSGSDYALAIEKYVGGIKTNLDDSLSKNIFFANLHESFYGELEAISGLGAKAAAEWDGLSQSQKVALEWLTRYFRMNGKNADEMINYLIEIGILLDETVKKDKIFSEKEIAAQAEELEKLTSKLKDLESIISAVNGGTEYSSMQIMDIIEKSPVLRNHIEATTNGYKIQKTALDALSTSVANNMLAIKKQTLAMTEHNALLSGAFKSEGINRFITRIQAARGDEKAIGALIKSSNADISAWAIALQDYYSSRDILENIVENGFKSGSSGSSSSDSKEDTWKAEFNKYLNDLKYNLDKGLITENAYYNELEKLNSKYFKNKSEYLDEYRQYEIEVLNGLKKLEENRLNDLLSKYESANKSVLSVLEDESDAIKKDYDERIEKIQEEIDLLREKNDEIDRATELEKAQNALESAKRNKTALVFREGIGWVREADKEAIAEAQRGVDKLKTDALVEEKEKQIEELEKQRDKETDVLADLKTKWQETLDLTNEAANYSNMLELIGDIENMSYKKRLDALTAFAKKYTSVQGEIAILTGSSDSLVPVKIPAYSTGGVDSSGGLTMLHGSASSVETIFNAEQGKKLFNFISALPSEYLKGGVGVVSPMTGQKPSISDGQKFYIQTLTVRADDGYTVDKFVTDLTRQAKIINRR